MELKIDTRDVHWWFWAVSLVFIVLALGGMTWAYAAVIAVSAFHVLFMVAQEKSLSAFPTQVRVVYFLFTLFGLWPAARWPMYLVLLIGTVMVTFFGRCAIALVLKQMPWNHGARLG